MKFLFLLLGGVLLVSAVPRAGCSDEEPEGDSIQVGALRFSVAQGEWGRLEYFPIYLEPSDDYFAYSRHLLGWEEGAVWRFRADDEDGVRQVLLDSGLVKETAEKIAASPFLQKNDTSGLFELRPPDDIVLGLSDETRIDLYGKLEPREETNLYWNPFEVPAGGVEPLLRVPTGLTPSLEDMLRKLCYQRDKSTFFSDSAFLLKQAGDAPSRLRVMKTLLREKSLNVRFRVPHNQSYEGILKYWEAGGRNRQVSPILDAVEEKDSISHLDLVHLLPPVPRKLLHTFPSPMGEFMMTSRPDCFWTSFSFFSEDPSYRFFDTVKYIFAERYERVTGEKRFGDLVVIHREPDGTPIHACNYLAGDLVFTKNGESMSRPWVISTLREVTEDYLYKGPVKVIIYRLKPEYVN